MQPKQKEPTKKPGVNANRPGRNTTGKTITTAAGKIRPGQFKPLKKATAAEVADRIETCASLLVKGALPGEIHSVMAAKFDITWATVEQIYVPRAKKLIRERSQMTPEQAKALGIGILLDCLKTGKPADRIRVEERLCAIFGYAVPKKLQVTGADDEPLIPKQEDDFIFRALRKAYGKPAVVLDVQPAKKARELTVGDVTK